MSRENVHWLLDALQNPTILILMVGLVGSYFTLSNQSANNARDIQQLQIQIDESLNDIELALADQSNRFELYLDSLRQVRMDNEGDVEALHAQFEELEDRVLLLENRNQ